MNALEIYLKYSFSFGTLPNVTKYKNVSCYSITKYYK